MSTLSTHVLDTSSGRPAEGLSVLLERQAEGSLWQEVARGSTDADGRARELLPAGESLAPGIYKLTFDTSAYFASHGLRGFYPFVAVVFVIDAAREHYHVPLLLSPYGYSTYRGS